MLSPLSNQVMAPHVGQGDNSRFLSPRLWSFAQGSGLSADGSQNGDFIADQFLNFGDLNPGAGGTTSGVHSGYGYYLDTATAAGSIRQLATEVGGVIRFTTGGNDNDEAWLTSGGNQGVLGKISDGDPKLMIFESRVRFGQVSDDYNAFVGLGEEGLAAADTITDAGAMASKDLIGFEVLEADGNSMNFIYRKAGETQNTVIDGVQALSADTWYKIGFVFDLRRDASKAIRIYVDNTEQSTYVTESDIGSSDFPDGEELAFLAGLKEGAAAAKTMDMDWWAFFQAG